MAGFPFVCQTCGAQKVSRTSVRGKFCNRVCFGQSIRVERPIEVKKEIKRLYDLEYRKKNTELLKRKKHESFVRDYKNNPEKYRLQRLSRRERHKAYLATYNSRPEWKSHKKDYDRKWRAQKKFGPLWESHYLTVLLDEEIKARMSKYEIRLQNGTMNKAQRRIRNGKVKRGYA